MDTKFLWLLFLLMVAPLGGTPAAAARSNRSCRNLEIMKQLKRLNKPYVKSIKSPDGDIIDCVLIENQPAFDHPLLKNHTIQMRPENHPHWPVGASKNEESWDSITQIWHTNGSCPDGTIPIRRTRKRDILRAKYFKKTMPRGPRPAWDAPESGTDMDDMHEYALAYVEGDKYYGTKATLNVWNPSPQQDTEFSLAQLWIADGSFDSDFSTIEAGWQVYPLLYGDNKTRLFIYWTSDGYKKTGCYNLGCTGFVQTNKRVVLGGTISPLSDYEKDQYDITLLVWRDLKEGNWWLQYGDKEVVGYWPGSLFSHFAEGASTVHWGGEVVNEQSNDEHTSTPMGSGHFPQEKFGKASFFNNLLTVDAYKRFEPPNDVHILTSVSGCYDLELGQSEGWGTYFYYGGPGRNPNCP